LNYRATQGLGISHFIFLCQALFLKGLWLLKSGIHLLFVEKARTEYSFTKRIVRCLIKRNCWMRYCLVVLGFVVSAIFATTVEAGTADFPCKNHSFTISIG